MNSVGQDSTIFWFIIILKIVLFGILTLIFTPYCLWIFYQDRQQSFARKRRPILVYLLVIICVILSAYNTFLDKNTCFATLCNELPISIKIHNLCIHLPIASLITCVTTRVWFLFYDLQYCESILSHQWWLNITDQKDWFIEHKNTYGSLRKYMNKRIILFIILWTALIIVCDIYYTSIVSFIVLIIPIIFMFIFMVILFYKMPKEYDVLLIRKEINRLTLFCCVSSIYYSITTTCFPDVVGISIFSSFYFYILHVVIVGMCTLWPHYHKSLQQHTQSSYSLKRSSSIQDVRRVSLRNHSPIPSRTSIQLSKPTIWQKFVNECDDDKNWNLFMSFLAKEIAVENLCFILEAIQFKQQLITKKEMNTINKIFKKKQKYFLTDINIGYFMKLPNKLPLCSFICNYDDYKTQIQHMYDKYISSSAALSINISYETRVTFMREMEYIINYDDNDLDDIQMSTELKSIDSNQLQFQVRSTSLRAFATDVEIDNHIKERLLKLFDDALIDVNRNLCGSFYRFKNSLEITFKH